LEFGGDEPIARSGGADGSILDARAAAADAMALDELDEPPEQLTPSIRTVDW
jgi:hypothetical protein